MQVGIYGIEIEEFIEITQADVDERNAMENQALSDKLAAGEITQTQYDQASVLVSLDDIVEEKKILFDAKKQRLENEDIFVTLFAGESFPPAGQKFDLPGGVLIEKSPGEQYADDEISDEEYREQLIDELNELANSIETDGIYVTLPEGPVNVTTPLGETTQAGSEINGGTWPFQTNEKSMQAIADEYGSIGAGLTLSDFWITSDNNIISPLTQNNFLAIAQAAKDHVASVRLKLRQKKNEIQNMETAQLSALNDMEEFWEAS